MHDLKSWAGSIPPATGRVEISDPQAGQSLDLQLEVFINGASRELIAAFHQDVDGALAIAPDQLRNVGIYPAREAMRPDGLVDIARLPGVTYEYDEASQSIHFNVQFDSLSARVINAHEGTGKERVPEARSGLGGLVNYSLYASTGGGEIENIWNFEGVSGWFEGRLFSPLGVLTNSYVARFSPNDRYHSTRLNTTWAYSNPKWMTTFRAGDVITGGLNWTRPTRLGGIQIQRNFGLRPDLVTMPLPELSGSAAVPSTVDVYVNNARRISQQVPAGPFQITNLPVVTGNGTARVVVRDALGRETVSVTPFFASSALLAPGFWDYSAEAGFARRFYGVESNDYDERFMASGTLRYGVSDWLTLEAHAEGGGGLVNGGAGAVFGLGPYGVGSFAAAASTYEGLTGFQIAGSVEFDLGGYLHVFARTQRTFDNYFDIAAVTAEPLSSPSTGSGFISAAPPRALDQVSLSVPLKFDPATLNFSYTNLETFEGERSQILGLSFNRQIGRASVFATAFTDLEVEDSFGIFAGLSIPLGGDIYASSGITSDADGIVVTADMIKPESREIGSFGWRLRDTEGAYTNRSASVSYRSPVARFKFSAEQYDDLYRAAGQIDGAIVFAGQDVFFSNRIDDAFAIVETGAPGVEVEYENGPIGRTNSRGKLLVTDLRSYEKNRISIDPTDLPVNATISGTREIAVPADRSGMVVKFDVDTEPQAALVTLRDENGAYLQPGASGVLKNTGENFVIGYDGQAYITGLGSKNRVVVDQPGRDRCAAEFSFRPHKGQQVSIPDAVCRPI